VKTNGKNRKIKYKNRSRTLFNRKEKEKFIAVVR
jgi:hypothetical protein